MPQREEIDGPGSSQKLVSTPGWRPDDEDRVAKAVRVTSPLVVAAELRRLCDQWAAEVGVPKAQATREQRCWLGAIKEIRRRATELAELGEERVMVELSRVTVV